MFCRTIPSGSVLVALMPGVHSERSPVSKPEVQTTVAFADPVAASSPRHARGVSHRRWFDLMEGPMRIGVEMLAARARARGPATVYDLRARAPLVAWR